MIGTLIKKERIALNISQEALAHGICAPSYLSKIENETTICSDEIIQLLFHRLSIDYIYDELLLDQFEEAYSLWFEGYFFDEDRCGYKLCQEMIQISKQYFYSPKTIEAHLLNYLVDVVPSWEEIDIFSKYTNDRNQLLLTLVQAKYHFTNNNIIKAIEVIESLPLAKYPMVYNQLADYYFSFGDYNKAIEWAKTSFHHYSQRGYLEILMRLSSTLSSSYYNLFDYTNAEMWNNTLLRFAVKLQHSGFEGLAYYNHGASVFQAEHYKEAEKYLLKSIEIKDGMDDLFSNYQKRGINAVFLKDLEIAKECLSFIEKSDHPLKDISVRLLHFMISNEEFNYTKEYCELLEECYEMVLHKKHYGMTLYYVMLLYRGYKNTNQYKKALLLKEKYNFPVF